MSKVATTKIDYLSDDLDDDFDTKEKPAKPASISPGLSKSVSPGPLRGKGQLTLHTNLAHRLFYGRRSSKEQEAITGLLRFTNNVNLMWSSAASDDPYADYYLLEIDKALDESSEFIKQSRNDIEPLLGDDDDDGFIVPARVSVNPVSLDIEFRNSYGYRASRTLLAYDKLIRTAHTLMHIGMIDRSDWQRLVNTSGRKIRNAFSLSDKWKFTGVTRDDFAANNPRAENAKQKMGDLDKGVLHGEVRSKYAPDVKKSETVSA